MSINTEVEEPGDVIDVILNPILLGSVLLTSDLELDFVPPFGLTLLSEYETIVLPLVIFTKSTFSETGTGQLLVRSSVSDPLEKVADVKEPNPPLPYGPRLVELKLGKGTVLPLAEVILKPASSAIEPNVIL